MFDISLGELSVIGAVALVVLGPEKLPKVARAAGLMLGRAQRMAADFRADLERDLHNSELAELGKQMTEEEKKIREELNAVSTEAHQALYDLEPTHYGEPDPELDALEHRRYGGSDPEPETEHDELHHPYHDETDPELQALDLQRYGAIENESENLAVVEGSVAAAAVSVSSATPEIAAGALAAPTNKVEPAAQEQALPLQPDLFAPTVTVPPEKVWRDRR